MQRLGKLDAHQLGRIGSMAAFLGMIIGLLWSMTELVFERNSNIGIAIMVAGREIDIVIIGLMIKFYPGAPETLAITRVKSKYIIGFFADAAL